MIAPSARRWGLFFSASSMSSMGVTLSNDGERARLALQGVVDIFEARELHRMALGALQAPGGVVVSLEEVTRVDTAATQVLLALKRALSSQGKTFALEAVPAGVRESWRFLGLAGEMGSQ